MANGELEDRFEFKYDDLHFIYFKNVNEIQRLETGTCIGNIYCLDRNLNDEIEVIEENKEIEELNKISYDEFKYSDNKHRFDLTNREYDKINEVIRAVNKLIKEREEK